MRKLLFLLVLILSAPSLARAGGTCPSGTLYLQLSDPGFPLLTLSGIGVTSCYFIASNGSDSNDGLSELVGHPWAHLPGMAGCSGNCALLTPAAGEGFIFRGGDSWLATNFGANGVRWIWSGTAANPVYIGVDQTWFSGGSWARPIFNAQQNTFNQFFTLASNWVVVDWAEFTGVFFTGTATVSTGTNGVTVCGTNDYVQNAYEHGWSWTTPWQSQNGATNSSLFNIGQGCDQGSSVGVTIRYSVVDGSDTANQNTAVVTGAAPTIIPNAYGNYFTWGTWSGLDGCGDNWHDNTVINAGIPLNSAVSGASFHQNMIKHLGPCNLTNIFSYNNVVYNQIAWSEDTGAVKYWVNGSDGAYTTFWFNNVVANVGTGNIIDFGSQTHTGASGTAYGFNNSIECGRDSSIGLCTYGNGQQAGSTMTGHFSNNQWIMSGSSICVGLCPSTGYSFTEANDQYSTSVPAGYSSSSTYSLQPQSSTGVTVNAGINNSSLCSTINALNPVAGAACLHGTSYGCTYNSTTHSVSCPNLALVVRPTGTLPWNVGAYQFSGPLAPVSTITWTNVHQTLDGFGVSDMFQGSAMTSGNADTMFSTTTGAGLSILRTLVPSNCADNSGSCTTVNSGCAGANTGDMALAIARGALIFSTPTTPPANYKTNGSCTNGGSLCAAVGGLCTANEYPAYATWLTNYVQSVQTFASITPYALSVQNEPNFTATYDSAIWTAQNLHDFILNNLEPDFTAASLTTKIMMPEVNCYSGGAGGASLSSLAGTTMNDPAAANAVDILADHDYCNNQGVNPFTTPVKPLWMTEFAILNGAFDPSIATAVNTFAFRVHNAMENGLTAWVYWTWHSSNPSQQLIDISTGNVSQTLWVLGNWSRWARPGCQRIDATPNPQTNVYVTAFKCSNGNFSIVAVNKGASAVNQTFNFAAFPGITGGTVTPYLTSGTTNHLAVQSAVSAISTFTYSLPSESVTTFVGGTSTTSPVVSWSPTSKAFGTVTIGATPTQVFTLSNTGTATLNVSLSISGSSAFTIPSNTCGTTVAVSGSCSVTVQFAPVAAVAYSATLVETDVTHGVSGSATLTGTGQTASAPAISWTPSGFNFGNVTTGGTPTQLFTLKNTGSAILNVSLSVTGTGFSQTNTCASTLTAGSTCTATVTFSPVAVQAYSGTLLETDTPNSVTGSATLAGNGVAASAPAVTWTSPTGVGSYNFGSVQVNQPGIAVLNLTNSGSATLNVSLQLGGSPALVFSETDNCPSTLTAGSSCQVTVQFVPVAPISYSGLLIETDSTNNVTGTAILSGNGVPPTINSQPLIL